MYDCMDVWILLAFSGKKKLFLHDMAHNGAQLSVCPFITTLSIENINFLCQDKT